MQLDLPNGLKVAYLEGVYDSERYHQPAKDDRYYTHQEVESLKQAIFGMEGNVDFFLSCDWPKNITNYLSESVVEGFRSTFSRRKL